MENNHENHQETLEKAHATTQEAPDPYQIKYQRLEQLMRLAEEQNNQLTAKLMQIKKHVNLMKLERTILLGKLENSKGKSGLQVLKRKRDELEFEVDGQGFVSDEEDVKPVASAVSYPKPPALVKVPSFVKQPSAPSTPKLPPPPKQPPTSFQLFLKDKMGEFPGKTVTEVKTILSPIWKGMTAEEKKKWVDQHKEDMKQHKILLQEYQDKHGISASKATSPSKKEDDDIDELVE